LPLRSDLGNHLGCRHLTLLDRGVAESRVEASRWRDPALQVMAERGLEHERQYLTHLEEQKLEVVHLPEDGPEAELLAKTLEAMRAGPDVIAQPTLGKGRWHGRADVLRRVTTSSHLGAFSYEPYDTKLARETRGSAILQLCLYAELLVRDAGASCRRRCTSSLPALASPRTPSESTTFSPITGWVKGRLESALEQPFPELPLPVPEQLRSATPAASGNAVTRSVTTPTILPSSPGSHGCSGASSPTENVSTLAGLAHVALPLPWKPRRG